MIKILNKNESVFNSKKFLAFAKSRNANLDEEMVSSLVELYAKFCEAEGVDIVVALSQVLYETVNFTYRNKNKKENNNFGGVRLENKYTTFPSVEEGVKAHIQLLKALSTKESLTTEPCELYKNMVESGSLGVAPTVISLSGTWVYPGFNKNKYPDLATANANSDSYGCSIESIYNEYRNFDFVEKEEEAVEIPVVENVVDTTPVIEEKVEEPKVVSVKDLNLKTTNHTAVAAKTAVSSNPVNAKSNDPSYRVLCGSFKDTRRAENIKNKLIRKGFNASIETENGLQKVYSGTYGIRDNAVDHMRKILGAGISCTIITTNKF